MLDEILTCARQFRGGQVVSEWNSLGPILFAPPWGVGARGEYRLVEISDADGQGMEVRSAA
jgi:hypothetical protein